MSKTSMLMLIFLSCFHAARAGAAEAVVRVSGGKLVDEGGRTVILRGINISNSSKHPPYLPWQTEDDFDRMKEWGFNVVRLLIEWAALEPVPNKFNEEHLRKLEKYIDWAAERGIYVILDMHQDGYGERYRGNGAPRWACIDGGIEPSVARNFPWFYIYADAAVMRAFENFWLDSPASDGVGVQRHYIRTWRNVARYFRNDGRIIGYDLMNEPFCGVDFARILQRAVRVFVETVPPEEYEIASTVLTNPRNIAPVLSYFHDNKVLYDALAQLEDISGQFELTRLVPFYERLISEIAEEDANRIFFIEPHILKGTGCRSFLARPNVPAEIGVCYAPHYYDPTIAWKYPYDGNMERGEIAFRRIAEEGERMGVPVFLGEWGGLSDKVPGACRHIADQMSLIEKFRFSSAYWEFGRNFARMEFLREIVRPYPRKIAGELIGYSFDSVRKVFSLTYAEMGVEPPTEIFIPRGFHYPRGFEVLSSDPAGKWHYEWNEKESVLLLYHDPTASVHRVIVRS